MRSCTFYKSKRKALLNLITPAIMTGMLIAFAVADQDVLDNWVAWVWIAAIVIVSHGAISDFFQTDPEITIDETGLHSHGMIRWSEVNQIFLIQKRSGPNIRKLLELERHAGKPIRLDVTDLDKRPDEIYEIVYPFWRENRTNQDHMLEPTSQPVATPRNAEPPNPAPNTCPTCGHSVSEDDWECGECYERLV